MYLQGLAFCLDKVHKRIDMSSRFEVSFDLGMVSRFNMIQDVSPRGMEAEATDRADAIEAPPDSAETAEMAETEEQPAADAVCLRSSICLSACLQRNRTFRRF